MLYADFSTRLQVLLQIDPASDADFATLLPAAIEEAELRCYRDLDPIAARKSAPIATAAAAATMVLPADCSIARELTYTPMPAGVLSPHLLRRDSSFLVELYPDPTQTGLPKYWALTDNATVLLAPTPAAVLPLRLSYTTRPTPLSGQNTSTWLSTWCPDLMVFAAMVYASGYQRNYGAQTDDPTQGMSWEKQYQRALTTAKIEEARRKGDGLFDASPAPPPSSTRPTGAPPGG